MLLIVFLVIAYLMGAIPFSFIIGQKIKGIDLRQHGSGNLGATNVFRNLGAGWGLLCLLLDIAKGALSVLLMTWLVNQWPVGEPTPLNLTPDIFRIFAGAMAALGHTFSPFVSFKGGKGVATTAGCFLVLEPYAALIALAIFGVVFATTRIVSLGSICAAAVLPFAVAFFEYRSPHSFSRTLFIFTTVICLWVLVRHAANFKRLQNGTEGKLEPGRLEDIDKKPDNDV